MCASIFIRFFLWRARKSNARDKTASVVVKDLRFKDEEKDKESRPPDREWEREESIFKDKDKDLMSKDEDKEEDLKIGPWGQGLSSRTIAL